MEHSAMNPRARPWDGVTPMNETFPDHGVDAEAEPGLGGLGWTEERYVEYDRHYQQEDEEQSQQDEDGDAKGMAFSEPLARRSCMVCWKSVEEPPRSNYVNLPCGENYCVGCLRAAFEFSLRCEFNFPLLCGCKQRVQIEDVYHLLGRELLRKYYAVSREWYSAHRTYCAKCFQYLDSQEYSEDQRYSICNVCDTWTCRKCKASKAKHDGGCPRDLDQERLMELSATMKWRQCKSCGSLIERSEGCDHMICICGCEFCYVCGRSHRDNPPCDYGGHHSDIEADDWDDQLAGSEPFALDPGNVPACEHASFRYSSFAGRCGGACGDMLPFYLNECLDCGARFCNNCVATRSFVPRERNDEHVVTPMVEQGDPDQDQLMALARLFDASSIS